MNAPSYAVSYARQARQRGRSRALLIFLLGFLLGAAACSSLIRYRHESAMRALEMADPVPAAPIRPALSPDPARNRVSSGMQDRLGAFANRLQIGFQPSGAVWTPLKANFAPQRVLAEAGEPIQLSSFSPGMVLAGVFVLVSVGFGSVLILLQRSRGSLARELHMVIQANEAREAKNRFPNPVQVVEQVQFATKSDVQEVKDEVEKSRSEREKNFEDLSERMGGIERLERQSTDKVHQRIDRVAERLGNVEGELKQVGQGVGKITTLLMTRAREGGS